MDKQMQLELIVILHLCVVGYALGLLKAAKDFPHYINISKEEFLTQVRLEILFWKAVLQKFWREIVGVSLLVASLSWLIGYFTIFK